MYKKEKRLTEAQNMFAYIGKKGGRGQGEQAPKGGEGDEHLAEARNIFENISKKGARDQGGQGPKGGRSWECTRSGPRGKITHADY